MNQTIDIGSRIELVPMDPHFHNITVALYRQDRTEGPTFLVHTYSRLKGAVKRIKSVALGMEILGGMQPTPDGLLRFPCCSNHELGCRRIFLEACKLNPDSLTQPRPLHTLDKKSGLAISVVNLGNGTYKVIAGGEGENQEKRVSVIAGGLMKLGQMLNNDETPGGIAFSCGHPHDAMVGLLLTRAPNVRAVIRDEKSLTSRGVLSAPSQQ